MLSEVRGDLSDSDSVVQQILGRDERHSMIYEGTTTAHR